MKLRGIHDNMQTIKYSTNFEDKKARAEAIRRYCSKNIGNLIRDENMKGMVTYKEGTIEANLIEEGKSELTLILTAPEGLIDSFMEEIQSPQYLGQKFLLESK